MSPAENSKPPSGGSITTDQCLTHIRDAAHSESNAVLRLACSLVEWVGVSVCCSVCCSVWVWVCDAACVAVFGTLDFHL